MWRMYRRTRKLRANAETKLYWRGYLCIFFPREGCSKINFGSFWVHCWSRSSNLKACKEDKFREFCESESFWFDICVPVKNDDMGMFWGKLCRTDGIWRLNWFADTTFHPCLNNVPNCLFYLIMYLFYVDSHVY